MKCVKKHCNRQSIEDSNFCSDHQPVPSEKLYSRDYDRGGQQQQQQQQRQIPRHDRDKSDVDKK